MKILNSSNFIEMISVMEEMFVSSLGSCLNWAWAASWAYLQDSRECHLITHDFTFVYSIGILFVKGWLRNVSIIIIIIIMLSSKYYRQDYDKYQSNQD